MISGHPDEGFEPSRVEFDDFFVDVLKLTIARLRHYELHALQQFGRFAVFDDSMADETHLEIKIRRLRTGYVLRPLAGQHC